MVVSGAPEGFSGRRDTSAGAKGTSEGARRTSEGATGRQSFYTDFAVSLCLATDYTDFTD